MALLHRIGHIAGKAAHLAGMGFQTGVGLFGASLDLTLRLVARSYDRFDAGFSELAAQSRRRKGARGGTVMPAE